MNNKFQRIIVRSIGLTVVLVILLLSIQSMGWFTSNTENDVNTFDMEAVCVPFELGTADSKTSYDFTTTNLDYIKANDGEKKTIADENGSSVNLSITADDTEIKWLINENSNISNIGNEESDGLQPGSRGIISFYLIPKKDGALNVNFNLDLALYDSNEDKVSDKSVSDFAQGHILLFQQYDENSKIFSDRINNTFSYNNPQVTSDTAYKVDIYWVWPDFVDELILPKDDKLFDGRNYNRILGDDTDFYDDMSSNSQYYFSGDTETAVSAMLSYVCKGSADSEFNTNYYKTLNKLWNNADQIIGTSAAYIELKLSAY